MTHSRVRPVDLIFSSIGQLCSINFFEPPLRFLPSQKEIASNQIVLRPHHSGIFFIGFLLTAKACYSSLKNIVGWAIKHGITASRLHLTMPKVSKFCANDLQCHFVWNSEPNGFLITICIISIPKRIFLLIFTLRGDSVNA